MNPQRIIHIMKDNQHFQRTLAKPVFYKLNFIRNELTKVVNIIKRGGKWNARTNDEIFKLIFNPYEPPEGEPQGELSELQYEIQNRNGNACYGGDLADLTYNALRYNRYLLNPVFRIGAEIGFKKRQIVDCCMLKYRARLVNKGKDYGLENEVLNAYLTYKPEPSERQFNCALRRIEDLFERRESFRVRKKIRLW